MPSSALHPERCWFRATLGPSIGQCSGRLVRCHLLSRQFLKREGLGRFVNDPRTWVWGCGGITGCSGHHGAHDYAKTVRIPRHLLPAAVEQFAAEHDIEWKLGREYGPLEAAA